MIEYFSNRWSNFTEWTEEIIDQSPDLKYYIQDRAVIHGLPVAAISTVAAGYLFDCAKTSTAAIFGVVNYLTLTSLLEMIRSRHEIDKLEGAIIIGVSGVISMAFIQTVCKTSMTYQTAMVLGAAAFAGQVGRLVLSNPDS